MKLIKIAMVTGLSLMSTLALSEPELARFWKTISGGDF